MSAPPTTFQRIQGAALETFARHGFEASGIRQVAERAGIPSSLIYHYSRSKGQLLRIVVENGLRCLIEADRRAVAMVPEPTGQLAALAAVHVFVHAEHPQMARLLDTELRVLDGEDRTAVLALRDEVDAVWAGALGRGLRAGVIQIADVAVARLALIRMCNGVATWYSPAGRLDVVAIAQRFGDLVLGACRARPGATVDLPLLQGVVREIHEGVPGANRGDGSLLGRQGGQEEGE